MKQLLITIAAVVLVGCGPSVPDMDIHDAAADGNIEAVKYHLANGINVDAVNDRPWKTPLSLATREGHKEIVKLLIAKGADVNVKDKREQTPLHAAAFGGHKEIAELLIANGGDVNARNDFGWTPLHQAAYSFTEGPQKIRTIELLISKGANVNSKGESGGTPLDIANTWGREPAADLLRKHGGKHGTIHGAASGDDIEAVKEFLDAGKDVNAKDKGLGATPLHWAIFKGHKEIAELLISEGADVNAKAQESALGLTTPLDWAITRNHTEIADLLRKHGGKTAEELKVEGKTGKKSHHDLIGVDEDGDGFDAYDEKITGHSDNDPDDKPTQEEIDAVLAELEAAGN